MPRIKKKAAGAYHHGNLREAIVAAATKIVNDEGPLELTIRSVAVQLGVTHAAVYHHFEDRTAILAAVAEAAFVQLGEAIALRQAALGETALERFAASGLAYVSFAVKHPRLYGVMFGPEAAERHAYPALAEAAARVFELLRGSIAASQKDGMVAEGSPDEHALFAWSAVHGLASLIVGRQLGQLQLPTDDPERLAEGIVLRAFTGLAAKPEYQ
ncbi:TetR/AcrR family transcriptional regulator [Pendulispora brunnea]|uniref:TetR/AcrR family transcriptional regulator n=1 Tax=Pendulispora brunnea TaxID=2905690 RepID=A0ABZ2K2R0_9BACT